jgi:membrane protein DedA with SNARE-associated domain
MPEQNKSEPTELQRVKHALAQLELLRVGNLVSPLAALVAVLSTVGTNLKISFTLNTVPTVYLVVIATAVGLVIAFFIGLVVYRWRVAAKRNMIRKLRTTEAELFQRIEARLPDLLGGKL